MPASVSMGRKRSVSSGGRHPAQQRGQPSVEVPQHALGDLGPAQPLVVHGGFQPAERLLKIVDVGGLEQIFGHMAADGHIQVFEIAVAAQDHDLDLGIIPAEPLHQLQPVHPRHPYIGQDHIRFAGRHLVQHFLAAGAQGRHLVAPLPPGQAVCHAVAYIFFVVRNDQPVHRRPPMVPVSCCSYIPKKRGKGLPRKNHLYFPFYYTARSACIRPGALVVHRQFLSCKVKFCFSPSPSGCRFR